MKTKPRSPLLSARIDWIVLEILILFFATVAYTVLIWVDISGRVSQSTFETFKATVKEVVPFFQFALIYIVGAFELGGEIMLRFTSKMAQARAEGVEQGVEQGIEQGIAQGVEQGIAQGVEQGIAQGVEQGMDEVYREVAEWDRRRKDAEARGENFTEPPPTRPQTPPQQ